MKSKKVSVYHSFPPQSTDEKRVFVLKCSRGSVLPLEDGPEMKSAASCVKHAADTTVLMCGVKPGSVSATTEKKSLDMLSGPKCTSKVECGPSRLIRGAFKSSDIQDRQLFTPIAVC